MVRLKARGIGWIALLSLLTPTLALADLPPAWVWPTYSVDTQKENLLTVTQIVHYTERSYAKPVEVTPISRNAARYSTPEEALVSRFSAVLTGNFEWWLTTWDSASNVLVQAKNKAEGKDKTYWTQLWKEQYANAKFVVTRKIETGEYVILIYKTVGKGSAPTVDAIELPIVFKKVEDKWFTTLDLRADPLPIASPWVSGRTEERSSMY
jgi:hypothetical protein